LPISSWAWASPGKLWVIERFIDAVRRYLGALPEHSRGWLAGLRDRHVGRALMLLHGAPARAWTVDELGQHVGLSRSTLHQRFAEVIGQTPMQYLANWRMQLGAALLRDTAVTVAGVAQEVGYESEASFARAFKRLMGQPPAQWRRQAKGRNGTAAKNDNSKKERASSLESQPVDLRHDRRTRIHNPLVRGNRKSVAGKKGRVHARQADYSASVTPEPPISFGTSFILGSPSFILRCVS
jgi:AraC-like DNA-binding protein